MWLFLLFNFLTSFNLRCLQQFNNTPIRFFQENRNYFIILEWGIRRTFGIKNNSSPTIYIIWPALRRRVIFISENGFHACFRYSKTQRRQDEPGGNRTEGHRNCASTSSAFTMFVFHLCQSSSLGICVFSTGLYYRINSPSLLPISSRIACAPSPWA